MTITIASYIIIALLVGIILALGVAIDELRMIRKALKK
jgi:hypothetical protein